LNLYPQGAPSPGACSRYLPLEEVGVLRMLAIG